MSSWVKGSSWNSSTDSAPSRTLGQDKLFLYDIVANYRNSIDVDKFDYLARDSYALGMRTTYDFQRLLRNAKVIDNQICFHAKEVYNM